MSTSRIVFNLYPFSETLFLPNANIVAVDKTGQYTHLLQKATKATVNHYDITISAAENELLAIIGTLAPKNVEAHHKPLKAKTTVPLAKLLADPATKNIVEGYLYRHLDSFFSTLYQHRLPLTLDAEKRTFAKDVLVAYPRHELVPHLFFKKSEIGVEYRLQLGTEEEKWNIRKQNIVPLTNTEPAWLLVDYALFRVPGINGNMVKPFRQKDSVHIPPDKLHVYFKQFIAKNAARTRIEAEGFGMLAHESLDETRLELSENILEKNWLFKPVFTYKNIEFQPGERRQQVTTVHFEGDEVLLKQVRRNPELEAIRLETLKNLGLEQDGRLYRLPEQADLETHLRWIEKHRAELTEAGFSVAAPEVDGRKLITDIPQMNVHAEADGDWFDVRGRVEVGPFSFLFAAFALYLRKGERFFPLPDGRFFLIPEAWFARFADLALAAETDDEKMRLRKTQFTLLKKAELDVEEGHFPVIDPESVDYKVSPDLKATLRPYQLTGVKWLVGHFRHGFGACLADDMGLGKTLQTIALLLHVKENQFGAPDGLGASQLDLFQSHNSFSKPLRALLIMPASLVFNWQQELRKFAPSLFVCVHAGAKRLRDARAIAGHDVVLTTYQTARQDLSLFEKVPWQFIVLDESQQIKNRESEISKMARALQAPNRISLSGTPIENSLADLWTQMDFINPDTLGTYPFFKKTFQLPIEKQRDDAARERLFGLVKPFFLRRTKEEVAPDLPALTEQYFYSEMGDQQHKRYDKVKSAMRNEILSLFDDPKSRLMALQALMRLRQLANHPVLVDAEYEGGSGKFDDVMAQWDVIKRAGHKALFFSSFEKHLQLFRKRFEEEKIPYAWLTGDTPTAERSKAVQRFQEDASVQAFFMTIKAGGVGLNLTAADYVFVLDPWWNPAVESQAVARAHRIGQTKPVTALRFISRDTIEEKILVLQEKKRQLGKAMFEDPGAENPSLSREDVAMLLG